MAAVKVYLFYGQGGALTSSGIDVLEKRIQTRFPDYPVATYSWQDWSQVYYDIFKLDLDTKVVLIGFSLGANAISWIASQVSITRPIELFIALDPTWLSVVSPIRDNVLRAISFQNVNPIDVPLGHARIEGPTVEKINMFGLHGLLDLTDQFQSTCMEEIAKL